MSVPETGAWYLIVGGFLGEASFDDDSGDSMQWVQPSHRDVLWQFAGYGRRQVALAAGWAPDDVAAVKEIGREAGRDARFAERQAAAVPGCGATPGGSNTCVAKT